MTTTVHRDDSLVRGIAYVAVFAALVVALTLLPPVVLPFTPVPITFQVLAVALCGMVLGATRGGLAVLTYVALIAIGLPVAAGWKGGLGVITGPTGGYLVGFVLMAAVTGLVTTALRARGHLLRLVLAGLAGLPFAYLLGFAWLHVATGMGWSAAFANGVLPFIIWDVLKVALAAVVAAAVQRALPSIGR